MLSYKYAVVNTIFLYLFLSKPKKWSLIVLFLLACNTYAQEEALDSNSFFPAKNQLLFNRYLINPSYSVLGKHRSYLNILQRSERVNFDDNGQHYLVGFGHAMDKSAMGLAVSAQWNGVFRQIGFLSNYALSVPLSAESTLSFGANLSYNVLSVDQSKTILNQEDAELQKYEGSNLLQFQPALTFSVGNFDIGVFAKNLFNYNQSENELSTDLSLRSLRSSVGYTYALNRNDQVGSDIQLQGLVQFGEFGQTEPYYMGSFLVDWPRLGWAFTSYDVHDGLGIGLGAYLGKHLMLGYTVEKPLGKTQAKFGWNHEINMAYRIKEKNQGNEYTGLSKEDEKIAEIINNYEERLMQMNLANDSILVKTGSSTNNEILLSWLQAAQDSIYKQKEREMERRFEHMIRVLRKEITSHKQEQEQVIEDKLPEITPQKNRQQLTFTSDGPDSYYIIANVFKESQNAKSFQQYLRAFGIPAKSFFNHKNKLIYVYLDRYEQKEIAEKAKTQKWASTYKGTTWIYQNTKNNRTIADNYYSDD